MYPECETKLMLELAMESCLQQLRHEWNATRGHGCPGEWDRLICLPPAALGESVNLTCPDIPIFTKRGVVTHTCTRDGWDDPQPSYIHACGYVFHNEEGPDRQTDYMTLKTAYTVGYSSSLTSLALAMLILCLFRKLRCTRNYIHMHLFASFMLRAIFVFIKDRVLFTGEAIDNCAPAPATCKVVMVFFQYCIMANFSWLLVEGLYLHTLLLVSFFSERKYFYSYIIIGWGTPAVFVVVWTVCRVVYEDTGCWDNKGNLVLWWIIKGPILLSILINFMFFIGIIRILVKKLCSPDVGGSSSSHYKRLAKSTLLLIPLFGVHYIVFAFFPDEASELATRVRLYFELALGSFQGFVVAILYCFLNGEVQGELRRKWRRWHVQRFLERGGRHRHRHQHHQQQRHQQQHSSFMMSNGTSSGGLTTHMSLLHKSSPGGERASSSRDESTII
ncbi:vasoactive intestinal polypeptide receptor 1-like isoform X1 [Lampetra fluviatilis]